MMQQYNSILRAALGEKFNLWIEHNPAVHLLWTFNLLQVNEPPVENYSCVPFCQIFV